MILLQVGSEVIYGRMTDDELLAALEAKTLPFEEWTHHTHVRVAYSYLRRHPFPEALERTARGIRAYNAYSPQRRMRPDAKTTFIEPDLSPLPKILEP